MPDELSPVKIAIQLCWEASEGTADHEELRQVLSQFHEKASEGKPIDAELKYIIESIGRYLANEGNSLDEAFGFAKKKGAPAGNKLERNREVAHSILELRLNGETFASARKSVVKWPYLSKSVVNRIWRDHKGAAIDLAIVQRLPAGFTKEEKQRLKKIFRKQSKPLGSNVQDDIEKWLLI